MGRRAPAIASAFAAAVWSVAGAANEPEPFRPGPDCDLLCVWDGLERIRPDSVEILGVGRIDTGIRIETRYIACVDDTDDLDRFAAVIEQSGLGRRIVPGPGVDCAGLPRVVERAIDVIR